MAAAGGHWAKGGGGFRPVGWQPATKKGPVVNIEPLAQRDARISNYIDSYGLAKGARAELNAMYARVGTRLGGALQQAWDNRSSIADGAEILRLTRLFAGL